MELPEDPDKPNNFLVSRRAREVSQVLADAARVARFSSRARSAAQGSGYVARRGDKFLGLVKLASLILIVIIPNIISVIYFGLIASDQYVSEAKFTVASGAIPKMDGLGSVTGLPPMAIFQESNIIISYIESRALVDILDREINLRHKFGSSNIDWLSRFNQSESVEKLLAYWQDHIKATITAPAGIIKLEILAFSPKDAQVIANAIIVKCEEVVNSLNDKMRRDTTYLAEAELRKSSERLKITRMKIESVRNQEGVINTSEASNSLNKILLELETTLLKYKNEYETEKKYVDEVAPQLRVMKSKIDTLTLQIEAVKGRITKNNTLEIYSSSTKNEESVMSKTIRKISEVELEQKIAETAYSQAAIALEMAKQMSEKKYIYLHQITESSLAEEAILPKRKSYILLILLITIFGNKLINKAAEIIRDNSA